MSADGSGSGGARERVSGTFARVPTWLARRLKGQPMALGVFAIIFSAYWIPAEGVARFEYDDLAADFGIKRGRAIRAVEALRKAGGLVTKRRYQPGTGFLAGLDYFPVLTEPEEQEEPFRPVLSSKNETQAPECQNRDSGGRLSPPKSQNQHSGGGPEFQKQRLLSSTSGTAKIYRSVRTDQDKNTCHDLDDLKRAKVADASPPPSIKAFQAQPDNDEPESDADVRRRMAAQLSRQRVAMGWKH